MKPAKTLVDAVSGFRHNTLPVAGFFNLLLAIFNLIPLPPLDGGKVAIGLLPKSLAVPFAKLSRYGFLIIIAMFIVLPPLGKKLGVDLNVFDWIVAPPVHFAMELVRAVLFQR